MATGDELAGACLSCRDLDEARQKYPELIEQAMTTEHSPGEAIFRAHWAQGSTHHAGLRNLLSRVAAQLPPPSAAEQDPDYDDIPTQRIRVDRVANGDFWGFCCNKKMKIVLINDDSPASRAGLKTGLTVLEASGQRCLKPSDAYGPPNRGVSGELCLELVVTTAAVKAPAPAAAPAAAPKPEESQAQAAFAHSRGWGSKLRERDPAEDKGLRPGTWTCPGCGWLLRFTAEWRCVRCGATQPGAVPVDPKLLQEQLPKIAPLAKALSIPEELLLSAHPADVQVIIDGKIHESRECHSPKETVMNLLSLLPYRTNEPVDTKGLQDFVRRLQLPARTEAGLKALDAQGVRKVLGETWGGASRGSTGGEASPQLVGSVISYVSGELQRMRAVLSSAPLGENPLGLPWWHKDRAAELEAAKAGTAVGEGAPSAAVEPPAPAGDSAVPPPAKEAADDAAAKAPVVTDKPARRRDSREKERGRRSRSRERDRDRARDRDRDRDERDKGRRSRGRRSRSRGRGRR